MSGDSDTIPMLPAVAPRPFALLRYEDVSGVSGTGVIATGAMFPSTGTVALHWPEPNHSIAVWPSIEALLAVHGHEGRTAVKWLDAWRWN